VYVHRIHGLGDVAELEDGVLGEEADASISIHAGGV
jgi:hypothetical protein